MRGRSYSYSPSPPPRGYSRRYRSRRYRSPSPRGRYGGRTRDLPTSLLVRNLHRDTRVEDLREPFAEFGPFKDIYLPRDYYTGEPRGFGFVQYVDAADAADAKYHMDGQIFLGRELTVVFAEENRKKPSEMRARDRGRSRYDRRFPFRCSGSLSPYHYSRSPGYGYGRTYTRTPDYTPSPRRQSHFSSRSYSPGGRRYRERSYSKSPYVSRRGGRSSSFSRSRSRSRSPSLDYSR